MGAFDWVGQAGDWIKNRWSEDWADFRKTFKESWENLPGQVGNVNAGLVGMATAPFKDDGDFWGSARMWIDSSVNTASGLAGGTIGTLFQVPILHEAAWLLDKAYRYGFARPISTQWTFISNTHREAYMQGSNPAAELWENLRDFNEIKRAWNDSEYITPGQAIVYSASIAQLGLTDFEGSMKWADEHDPRTEAGQKTFNSQDAEFWLKYSSGALDFAGNVIADPAHGAASAVKLAKLRLVDHVADARYVMSGKVQLETKTSAYKKVYGLLIDADGKPTDLTPEEFRVLTMPDAARGGEIAKMLWTAARAGEDVYRDTYLTVRAGDFEAYQRLGEAMPKIAADYADEFANFTIADADYQRGNVHNAPGADALRKTKTDAFIDAFHAGEGLWGGSWGIGFREKMPRARASSKLKVGYHSWVLERAPIILGRPLSSVMPSQGWTTIIDANDTSGISLKQFKANVERANTASKARDLIRDDRELTLSPKEINGFTSRFGAATSDASRQAIAMQVDNLIAERMLKRAGLRPEDLPRVLDDLNKSRTGTRRLIGYERFFISDEARKRAELNAAQGRVEAAQDLAAYSEEIRKQADAGEISDQYARFTDVDGRLNLVPLDPKLPVLRSQFTEAITMLDYRALSGALRWWKMTHPKPKTLVDPDDFTNVTTVPLKAWEIGLSKLAKVRGLYDASISVLDAASSMWKASALLRPAQAPRNVASDTLLTFVEFGKLPLLLSASNIVPNAIRNFGPRGRLLWETVQEGMAKLRGQDRTRATVDADVDVTVDGNVGTTRPGPVPTYMDMGNAYSDGAISLYDYKMGLQDLFSGSVTAKSKRAASGAKVSKEQPFVPRATQGLIKQGRADKGLSGARPEKIDPTAMPGGKKPLPPRLQREPGEAPEFEDFGRERASATPEGYKYDRSFEKADKDYLPGEVGGWPVGGGARKGGAPVPAPYTGQWRIGAPYSVERALYGQLHDRIISQAQYDRAIVTAALTRARRDKFMKRDWGLGLIKELMSKHLDKRDLPGYKDNPYAPGTVVVDPFTGLKPQIADPDSGVKAEVAMQQLRDNFDITDEALLETRNVKGRLGQRAGTIASVVRGDVHKQLVRWIQDNSDVLLRPDTLLALRVKPDGNISVGLATAKRHVVEAGETLKAGARQRLKNFRYEGISDVGHTGFDVRDKAGNTVMSFDGWADGAIGQAMQRRVSSRDNPTTGFGALVNDVDVEDLLDEAGPWRPIQPRESNYGENWERDVNAQIASDPVARMFLQRKSNGEYFTDADVIATVEDTAWGTKWIKAMGFRGVAYVDQIRQIEAMVGTYIPHPNTPGINAAAATKLREAVLQKKATYSQLESMYKDAEGRVDFDGMPEIHGMSVRHVLGNARTWKFMRRVVAKVQHYVSDMPVDKWARFPFMSMAYQRHGTELAKVANEYFKDGPIPAEVQARIKDMAREKAYHDVRYRLYDTAQRNDFANATRLLMPFSAAMMDSYIKYGRVIRENPMLLVQGAYYWDMFERNNMVQDEEGNVAVIEGGTTKWYRIDPTTGEHTLVPEGEQGKHKYIQFQLPDALSRALGQKYYGVDAKPVFSVNKETMNVFLNTPSGGPLVAFPVNEFALSNPEFGENAMVRKYLLPFGPSSSRGKVFLPSTVRSAWDAFMAEDGDTAQGHAAAIMQAELIGYGLGTRNEPPTFEEVREKAAGMKVLRFWATFVSPASFQLESPYQPYVDAYRQLLADPATAKTAPEEFMRRHGDEYYAVTMSVTRNNAGLSATLESSEAYDKYRDLIIRYPEFGGLIVGKDNAGTFAKSVYEAQKETPVRPGDTRNIRELLPLRDSVEDLQKKTVWSKYSQLMDGITAAMEDRGVRTLRGRGAEDLAKTKAAFVEANKYWTDPATGKESISPWYLDFMSSDRGQEEKKFEALWTIARDEKLQNREDIRGLLEYLTLRDQMQREMAYWRFKSLDNEKAWGLRNKWEQQVYDIVESNTTFADLWNRWLSNDDKLDLPPVELGVPYGTGGSGYTALGN